MHGWNAGRLFLLFKNNTICCLWIQSVQKTDRVAGGYNGLNSTKCVIFTLLLVRRVLG